MASAQVPPKIPDPSLEEEGRTAVRILEGLRDQRPEARRELVERYSKGLFYILKRRLRDDETARDVLHDTFCIALKTLPNTRLDKPERLAGYLRGIAIRVAFSAMRQRKREPGAVDQVILDSIENPEPQPFEMLSTEEVTLAVRRLLRLLPVDRDRELLFRLYVRGEEKEEICKALNLNSLHFSRVLYRAKARFREIVERSGAVDFG